MPFTLTMPKLSPTMEEGSIAKWHKKIGDYVEVGDLLLEVSTDKATVEHNALDGGWLRKILVDEGKTVFVNQAIAIMSEKKEERIEGYIPTGLQQKVVEKSLDVTGLVSEEKPNEVARQALTNVPFQQPSFVPEQPLKNYLFALNTEASGKRVLASPLARKLAKDKGLDLATVKGSGPNGRIMSGDLVRAQPAGAFVFGRRSIPTEQPGAYREESLTPIRKIIGQRLQESKSFIPHFYVQQAINAGALVEIREQLANLAIKISVNDLVIKACALSLKAHPAVNSGFNSVNQTIIRYQTVDISVAVSVDGGLITPIIRHADYKNVGEISVEVKGLARRAKEGKLEPHEYKGGSFTISNIGMYGVSNFQAIINPPQAAIIAIAGIQDLPIVKNGVVVPGKMMNVTLSADHRVIDGVAAAEFLKTLQKYLENPACLLI